jgi:rSAM-associated Gly-rich repeat protein
MAGSISNNQPEGDLMSVKTQVSKALSVVLPGGALGASIVLAMMAQAPAADAAQVEQDTSGSVAEQLAQIRSGVSALLPKSDTSDQNGSADPSLQGNAAALVPTWWANGRWGRWGAGWGNGGWGNGGWPNWHNWGNGGWPNWGNGWHNFWHNG